MLTPHLFADFINASDYFNATTFFNAIDSGSFVAPQEELVFSENTKEWQKFFETPARDGGLGATPLEEPPQVAAPAPAPSPTHFDLAVKDVSAISKIFST